MPNKRLITLISEPKGFWMGMPATISVSSLHTAGINFDEILDVNDITGDGANWGKSLPGSGLLLGTHIVLTYTSGTPTSGFTGQTAPVGFHPGVKVSIRKIEVTFVSGHIEVFDIPLSAVMWWAPPASPNFMFNSALVGSANLINLGTQYHGDCINDNPQSDIDPMTSLPSNPFYSVTHDTKEGLFGMQVGGVQIPITGAVTSPFATFTKYSGINATTVGGNTNPTFTPSEIFQKTDAVPEAKLRTSFLQPSQAGWTSHYDWIAYQYGFNGFTTPDMFNPNQLSIDDLRRY